MPDQLKDFITTTSSIWQWLAGGIVAAGGTVWAYLTGRIKRVEEATITIITMRMRLDEHIKDEETTFNVIFDKLDKMSEKHDNMAEKISLAASSLARIEGRLDK